MRWQILNKNKNQDLVKILLENRGYKTKKEQEKFLNPRDPYKLTVKDVSISEAQIKKAIARIKKAIRNQEKIIIYGDYDTDGVCATAILWETLHQLKAEVMPFIPTREESYGMKVNRVEQMAKNGIKLIITVDQGIVAYAAAKKAKELGIDLIVTDHHVAGEKMPEASAIIHTTKLAGAGVSWFLANRLAPKIPLDLVTIATITDVVPLVGPNRSIVKFGLADVRKTKRPGLLSLYQNARIKQEVISTYEIGFMIGPRLNASGRMDNPLDSLRLLCTNNQLAASKIAANLEKKNLARQQLTEELVKVARKRWLKEDGKSKLIFVADETFELGVIGLVAGKLMEEFYRPAVVVAKQGKVSRASARSIEELNIVEVIRSCTDIIGSHGGHKKAAGFSVETVKIEILRQRLVGLAEEKLKNIELTPTLKIDTEIGLESLSLKAYESIQKMAPFGEANPTPVFATRGIKVVNARLIGKDNQHLKLQVTCPLSHVAFDAIGFGMGNLYSQLATDRSIDIAYNLILNEWNGNKKLELKLKDIKVSS